MSPAKFSPVPRASPLYLARWEQQAGYWRLVIYHTDWELADSVFTPVPVTDAGPPTSDVWLLHTGFVQADGARWEQDGDGVWECAVAPGPGNRASSPLPVPLRHLPHRQ